MGLMVCCQELLVTQAQTEYLKQHATYEVVDYEENVFKGWTVEEAKSLLTDPRFPSEGQKPLPLYNEFKGGLETVVDWRQKNPQCIAAVHSQGGCTSSWAFTVAHMLGERVSLSLSYKITVLHPQ